MGTAVSGSDEPQRARRLQQGIIFLHFLNVLVRINPISVGKNEIKYYKIGLGLGVHARVRV